MNGNYYGYNPNPAYNGYPPNYYNQPPNPMFAAERNAVKEIKHYSRIAGLCVLGYVVMMLFVTGNLWSLLGLSSPSSDIVDSGISIINSILSVLLPFLLGALIIKKRKHINVFCFDRPVSTALMLLAVPMGLAFCLLGNYVTNILVSYLEGAGIYLTSDDYAVPTSIMGRLMCVLQVAVAPALCEELAIRGTVMQPLRKYGDTFAIVASSAVFAIMHGNLVQAPFAFLAGLVMGYAMCITGSIWTSVLIHFANNLFSVIVSFLVADITNEAKLNLIYSATVFIIGGVGIICAVIFLLLKKDIRLKPTPLYLTGRRAASSYAATAPMIISLLVMLWITSFYVSFNPPA